MIEDVDHKSSELQMLYFDFHILKVFCGCFFLAGKKSTDHRNGEQENQNKQIFHELKGLKELMCWF